MPNNNAIHPAQQGSIGYQQYQSSLQLPIRRKIFTMK